LALIHGAGDGGAGDEIGAIFGIDDGVADGTDAVTGATDALHTTGDGGRRFDLHDEIDGAHVDAQFEGRGGDDSAKSAELETIFNVFALRDGDAAVMGADQSFTSEIVDGAGNAFGEAAVVDEDQGGAMFADEGEEFRMNGGPDGGPSGGLGSGAAGKRIDLVEAGHVFDGNFDAEIETLRFAGVDDGDGAIDGSDDGGFEFDEGLVLYGDWGRCVSRVYCFGGYLCLLLPLRERRFGAAEKTGDFFEWALGGGKTDALKAASSEMLEAFQGKSEMRAAFGGNDGVNFVDDNGLDEAEEFAGLRGEHQVERFGSGDEDVGGMAEEAGAFGRGRVTSANGNGRLVKRETEALRGLGDADEWCAKIAFDIDGEGFDGGDVDDAAALGFWRSGSKHQAIDGPEKCGKGFAGTGGGENQSGLAVRDGGPAENLGTSGRGKDGGEPVADSGMKLIERVGRGHGLRSHGFRISWHVGGRNILSRFNSLDAFGRIRVADFRKPGRI
jgi:hypothetical protein